MLINMPYHNSSLAFSKYRFANSNLFNTNSFFLSFIIKILKFNSEIKILGGLRPHILFTGQGKKLMLYAFALKFHNYAFSPYYIFNYWTFGCFNCSSSQKTHIQRPWSSTKFCFLSYNLFPIKCSIYWCYSNYCLFRSYCCIFLICYNAFEFKRTPNGF